MTIYYEDLFWDDLEDEYGTEGLATFRLGCVTNVVYDNLDPKLSTRLWLGHNKSTYTGGYESIYTPSGQGSCAIWNITNLTGTSVYILETKIDSFDSIWCYWKNAMATMDPHCPDKCKTPPPYMAEGKVCWHDSGLFLSQNAQGLSTSNCYYFCLYENAIGNISLSDSNRASLGSIAYENSTISHILRIRIDGRQLTASHGTTNKLKYYYHLGKKIDYGIYDLKEVKTMTLSFDPIYAGLYAGGDIHYGYPKTNECDYPPNTQLGPGWTLFDHFRISKEIITDEKGITPEGIVYSPPPSVSISSPFWSTIYLNNFSNANSSITYNRPSGSIIEGGYIIDIQNGVNGDWWGGTAVHNSPIAYVTDITSSGYERYTAKISSFSYLSSSTAINNNARGGIVLYSDRDNAYMFNYTETTNRHVEVEKIVANTATTNLAWSSGSFPAINDPNEYPIFLRITNNKSTNKLDFEYQNYTTATGSSWTNLYSVNTCEFTASKIGMFSKNWSPYPSVRTGFQYFQIERSEDGSTWTEINNDFFQDGVDSYSKDAPVGGCLEPGSALSIFTDSSINCDWWDASYPHNCPIGYVDISSYTSGSYKFIMKIIDMNTPVSDNATSGITFYQDRNNAYLFDIRNYSSILSISKIVDNVSSEGIKSLTVERPSSANPIYLIVQYECKTNIVEFSYTRDNLDICDSFLVESCSITPQYFGGFVKNFSTYPLAYTIFSDLTIKHYDSYNHDIEEIDKNFTLNKYRILPYEHGAGVGKCNELYTKVTPFFLGTAGFNLRLRNKPESGSFG